MTPAQKMIHYCRRDTEIAGRFLQKMKEKYDEIGCPFKTTIASSSLSFFETEFSERLKHSFTEEQIDFFHSGYYGGRTEIFFNSPIEGRVWYHDINSLYPSCMAANIFPSLDYFYETKAPDFTLEGMADCEVSAPLCLKIPYLPHRHEGKLLFPVGVFRGVYTYFEIREAKRLGYSITKTFRAIEFPGRCSPFVKFIDTLYTERLKAKTAKDDLLQTAYKDIMNHGYGKFAQKNESTKLLPIYRMTPCDCDLPEEVPCTTEKHLRGGDTIFGELVLRKEKIEYPRYANCVWACYVTSYGRHALYPYLVQAERSGAVLLGCDTDSIIYEHRDALFSESPQLGGLKLERPTCHKCKVPLQDTYDYAHLKLPKLYALKCYKNCPNCDIQIKVYKAKGVPSRVAEEFFEKGSASFVKPIRMRESLRRNLSPKRIEKLVPNYWEENSKEMIGKYTKRTVLKTGHTVPIILKLESEKQNGHKSAKRKSRRTKNPHPAQPRIRKARKKAAKHQRTL